MLKAVEHPVEILRAEVKMWLCCSCDQVFLVRKISGKDTGQVFAMKVLKKVTLILHIGFSYWRNIKK